MLWRYKGRCRTTRSGSLQRAKRRMRRLRDTPTVTIHNDCSAQIAAIRDGVANGSNRPTPIIQPPWPCPEGISPTGLCRPDWGGKPPVRFRASMRPEISFQARLPEANPRQPPGYGAVDSSRILRTAPRQGRFRSRRRAAPPRPGGARGGASSIFYEARVASKGLGDLSLELRPADRPARVLRYQPRPPSASWLSYNLGNFLRTLATPRPIKDWSLTSLREKLIKIGAKVVSHGRFVAFQMAEVAVPRHLFVDIRRLIAEFGRRQSP
jgi:hypothetical protein